MTYSPDDHAAVDQEIRTYANLLGPVFIGLAVIWLVGAVVVFTAAYMGATMSSSSAAASAEPAPAATAPAEPAPAATQ